LHTDHFGNVVFNLRREAFRKWLGDESAPVRLRLVGVGGEAVELPLVRTFGEVGWGEPLAYWGSSGYLEVAVNGGSAAQRFAITDDAVLTLICG
jgi:S-adenosylmethionine hydrolase